MTRFSRLTRLQRITLVLFGVAVVNGIMVVAAGYSLMGGDLLTAAFVVSLTLLAFSFVPPLMRKVVWRVRNRLLVTYFLVGALPTLLIFTIAALGFYIFVGATGGYLNKSELDRRQEQLAAAARQRAQEVFEGTPHVQNEALPWQAVIQAGNQAARGQGPIREIPSWSKPGSKGIVRTNVPSYFMTAHAEFGTGARRVEVFAYSPFDDEFLTKLVRGLSIASLYRASDVLEAERAQFIPALDSTRVNPGPASRGFWDLEAMSSLPLDMRSLDTGRSDAHFLSFHSRPSAVLTRVLSPLGSFASAPVYFMLFLAATFLVVELIAVISSVKLTRSLTGTIHDIYAGTGKIETGDFSHRIPVRTKDQLSELATSFNSMTEHIERLIAEVKEKEKLEAELEIARQVQSQLFPKDIPKLKTLELTGLCNPARVVSGDYYDFIPFDPRWTALVIGDIAGKGISAALLMAAIQSSLHAQLKLSSNGVVSTATLVERLNRQLYENTSAEKYASFYCGVYDDQNGSLLYTNAGHLPPILVRRGKTIRLEPNGMVVGIVPDFPYQQDLIELQHGDLLAAFTDGITESEDAKGEQFGENRLTEILVRHAEKPLDEIIRIVTDAVRNWAYDLDNQDDTTMLLARRL